MWTAQFRIAGKDLVNATIALPSDEVLYDGTATLRPGAHRLTWDADADITADADFNRVSMSVKVEEK